MSPERITTADLEAFLRTQMLPQAALNRVLNQTAKRRLSPAVLWRWADRFGAAKLVLALDAEVAERSMQRHLDARTTPDWRALEIFAELAADAGSTSMPIQEVIDLDAVPEIAELTFPPDFDDWATAAGLIAPTTEEPLDLSRFGDLPPISGPGLPAPTPAPQPAQDPGRDGEIDGWPRAA